MSEPSLRSTAIEQALRELRPGFASERAAARIGVDAALRVIHTQRDAIIEALVPDPHDMSAVWLSRRDAERVADAVLATLTRGEGDV